MAGKIEKKEELDGTQVPSETPNRDKWRQGLIGKNPELEGADDEALYAASMDGYDAEHEANKIHAKDDEDKQRIQDAISKSPEVAAFMNRFLNPEDGAEPEEAFAALGDDLVDLLTGKIDNEAYRNKKAANAKAKADKEAADIAIKNEAGKAFTEACEKIGIEPEEAYSQLMAKYGKEGGEDFRADATFYEALLRSLTYDEDIAAAEARGRTQSFNERRGNSRGNSDGLPHRQTGGGAAIEKEDPNSLAAIGRRRARMS